MALLPLFCVLALCAGTVAAGMHASIIISDASGGAWELVVVDLCLRVCASVHASVCVCLG